jgi:hypothetical protein
METQQQKSGAWTPPSTHACVRDHHDPAGERAGQWVVGGKARRGQWDVRCNTDANANAAELLRRRTDAIQLSFGAILTRLTAELCPRYLRIIKTRGSSITRTRSVSRVHRWTAGLDWTELPHTSVAIVATVVAGIDPNNKNNPDINNDNTWRSVGTDDAAATHCRTLPPVRRSHSATVLSVEAVACIATCCTYQRNGLLLSSRSERPTRRAYDGRCC